jgi:hypothetical protein
MSEHSRPENGPNPPLDAILMQMLFGGLMQQSISVAAKLGIADLLAGQPLTAAELAAQTGTHEPSLYRVLRMLASVGIFSETDGGNFELTPLASLLRSDVPNSMRDVAIMQGEAWNCRNTIELMHSIRTGATGQEQAHGMGLFEYLSQHPEDGEVFGRAMTNLSLSVVPAVVEAYDFSGVGKLVDVAGGHGLLLAGILQANPQMRGVLFDQPRVVAGAGQLLEKEGVRNRVELAPGDFFDFIPPGADAYILKHIIHDWNDEQSVRILRNVRSAMGESGRILIVEMVVPEGNGPSPAKVMDVQMLIATGGKERTENEYKRLLESSGMRLNRIVPTKSPFSVIEGVCAPPEQS